MRVTFTIPSMTISVRRRRKVAGELLTKWTPEEWIGFYVADIWRLPAKRKIRARQWRHHVQAFTLRELTRTEDGRCLLRNRPRIPTGVSITTQAYFATRVHGDTENVHKGLVDALVGREGKGGRGRFLLLDDKEIAGSYGPQQYDKARPRVEVTIEWEVI